MMQCATQHAAGRRLLHLNIHIVDMFKVKVSSAEIVFLFQLTNNYIIVILFTPILSLHQQAMKLQPLPNTRGIIRENTHMNAHLLSHPAGPRPCETGYSSLLGKACGAV